MTKLSSKVKLISIQPDILKIVKIKKNQNQKI